MYKKIFFFNSLNALSLHVEDFNKENIEKLKIHCAEKHFEAIGNGVIKFAKISTFDKLLEMVSLH